MKLVGKTWRRVSASVRGLVRGAEPRLPDVVDREQPDGERRGGHDLKVEQGLHPDPAHLPDIAGSRDTLHDAAEDEGPYHQLY